jgi:hypothetical protein
MDYSSSFCAVTVADSAGWGITGEPGKRRSLPSTTTCVPGGRLGWIDGHVRVGFKYHIEDRGDGHLLFVLARYHHVGDGLAALSRHRIARDEHELTLDPGGNPRGHRHARLEHAVLVRERDHRGKRAGRQVDITDDGRPRRIKAYLQRRHFDHDLGFRTTHRPGVALGDVQPGFDGAGRHDFRNGITRSEPLADFGLLADDAAVERRSDGGVAKPNVQQVDLGGQHVQLLLRRGEEGLVDLHGGACVGEFLDVDGAFAVGFFEQFQIKIGLVEFRLALDHDRFGHDLPRLDLQQLELETPCIEDGQHIPGLHGLPGFDRQLQDDARFDAADAGSGHRAQVAGDHPVLLGLLDEDFGHAHRRRLLSQRGRREAGTRK